MAGKGGARPGAGRPAGEMNLAVQEFAHRCRKFLESPDRGIPRFERVAEDLLEPQIACRRNSKGEEIEGTEYLVNAGSMVSMLELLAGYAYGKPRQQVEHSGEIRTGFALEVPAPLDANAWLQANAESRQQMAEADGAVN